ncbi:hypothetical protein D0Z08_11290 [Nocardioides immobilis]|uniref:Uncharacterized protein n=1 Tax=Nocardioides immobilis TaxID=2049295 RepID=A0A417Y3U0_9ACTN|nr:hypothetical protein [Nocardioides immobilis]RHW27231.1 hypothetical protein D0Z08_11290 [Nocardioides immobilis]
MIEMIGLAACGDDAGSEPTSSGETSAGRSAEGAGLVGFGDEVGDPVTGSKPDRGEDVEGESLALPAGFPEKEIPLLSGRITSATGDEESGGWDVTIAVGCWDEIVCEEATYKQAARALRGAGFTEGVTTIDGETYGKAVVGGFDSDAFHVDVVAYGQEEGTILVAYVVRPAR